MHLASPNASTASPTDVSNMPASSSSGTQPSETATARDELEKSPKTEGLEGVAEDDREPSCLTQGLLFAIVALQGADTKLLPASMKALQQDIGVTLSDLSYMSMAQMISANVAAPLWGIMADRGTLQRRTILLLASLGQGLVTVSLAFVSDMPSMVFLRALNGVLLAALRPIVNGVVVDLTAEQRRGKIFGRVFTGFLLGMLATTLTVVPVATREVMGFHGWRVAWVVVGLISVLVSGLVYCFLEEPPREGGEGALPQGCAALRTELGRLLGFFSMPTFCVMVVKGVFESIPFSTFGYLTLFFQLTGIANSKVALISATGLLSAAAGVNLGGRIGDFLAGRFGLQGRPICAQVSLACAVPLFFALYVGIPPHEDHFWLYLVLLVLFGLFGTWAGSGTNWPVLAHIVPACDRNRVMAWEAALENSVADAVGPMLVALLAERAFGYDFGAARRGRQTRHGADILSASALGKALGATVCIPLLIAFVLTSLLHWSYPRDVRKLQRRAPAGPGLVVVV